MDEGPLGMGFLKGRRMGNPRTETERKERHQQLFGNTNLPQRGSGNGPLGFGVLGNVQKRVSTITKRR